MALRLNSPEPPFQRPASSLLTSTLPVVAFGAILLFSWGVVHRGRISSREHSLTEGSEFSQSVRVPENVVEIEHWRRCSVLEGVVPPLSAIPINLSSRCADAVWVLPLSPQTAVEPPSHDCTNACLDATCCTSFRAVRDHSNNSCELALGDGTQSVERERLLSVFEAPWYRILGVMDWKDHLMSRAGLGPRMVVIRGPQRVVYPLRDGRWHGAVVELQLVDAAGDLMHVVGGARVSLARRREGGAADWVLEADEIDVDRSTISYRFSTKLPVTVASRTTYVIYVLFAPHRRTAHLSRSLELAVEFSQSPVPYAVIVSYCFQFLNCVKLTLVDSLGLKTSVAQHGGDVATLLDASSDTGRPVGHIHFVNGEAVMRCNDSHSPAALRLGAQTFPLTAMVCAVPASSPTRDIQASGRKKFYAISLSASPTDIASRQGACLLCLLPLSIRRRLVVFTCHPALCDDTVRCIVVNCSSQSAFVQHYHNTREALRLWQNLSLSAIVLAEASMASSVTLAAVTHADSIEWNTSSAPTVVSPQFDFPHQLQDVRQWHVPIDVDLDPSVRMSSWWRLVGGMPHFASWLLQKGRLVVSPTCLRDTKLCAVVIRSPRVIQMVVEEMAAFMAPLPLSHASVSGEGKCYTFSAVVALILTI